MSDDLSSSALPASETGRLRAALEQASIDLQFLAGSLRLRGDGDPAKLTVAHALAWHREFKDLATICDGYAKRADAALQRPPASLSEQDEKKERT